MASLTSCVCVEPFLESASPLPENVHLICGKCRSCSNFYSTQDAGVSEVDLKGRTVLPSADLEAASVPQPTSTLENVTEREPWRKQWSGFVVGKFQT